ncbi:MAG: AMP-binding protein [Methanomassiliicoccales archaeon]|uniref:AMP-binding protein n=1 Tax=Candidatus Methanarcanum hacksteinii TaxID=2911857 RepID=UPI0026FD3614|nr:AMP-binding protein [Candidatus Methanomethylophilaceae archaeon]MCI6025522.1 AMP-binding protein [Methanomassiliicoccales archaeon]MDD7478531.1 AMP-binding protein [Methanomassiliicoccales archaeon]MDO5837955.1 AMP-binding protein [Methanomassiliicoccales archaeon]TQS78544.1 MAG: AMP-binding protein [Candidatus Methanarcanum hacksteinii]
MVCIPRKNPTSDERLGDLLDKCIREHPDNDAIVYVDRDLRYSWKEWGEEVDRVAKGLMAMGVKKGEKVAVWATNVPDWVTLMFATARIGAILLTINTNYQAAELDYVLKQSDMENLFLINGVRDTDYVDTVYKLIPELKEQPRDGFHSERYPHLKRVVFLGPEKYRGMFSMSEVKSKAVEISDDEYSVMKDAVDVHDVTMMQYTSGTTGFPKGVMLTHFNIANDGYWLGANMNYGSDDRLTLNVPLFHCFGCVLGVMACVNHCVTMVFCETFNPIDVMTSIEEEKCTAVYGVPTMFISMLNHKLFNKFDFSSLRTGIMAGSPCPIKAMEEVVDKMNMKEITIVYGLTEASPGMTQTRYDEPSIEKKCSSVGKRLPGVDVVILDPETNEPCPDGTVGEFCCKGFNVMKGYYKMPEETAKVIDKNGYLHSGDLGYRDSEGYFYVTGRIKDMIIRGGENIYPKEVEDFLYRCPGIKDVQVVGVPSKKYGEQPGAFIIREDGSNIDEQDVLEFCKGQIAWYKTPKYIAFVNEFPMNAAGKILKYKMRDQAHELWPDA